MYYALGLLIFLLWIVFKDDSNEDRYHSTSCLCNKCVRSFDKWSKQKEK